MSIKEVSWWTANHRLAGSAFISHSKSVINRPPANFFDTPEDAYVRESASGL